MPVSRRLLALTAASATASAGLYALVVSGALTLDVGIGRRLRPLGPLRVAIDATPPTVYDVIAARYLGRTPHAMAAKLSVLERSSDMVLAEHITTVSGGLRAHTLETVRFEEGRRVSFRLVRGPVPHVTETFDLHETAQGTELEYTGELGTDFWGAGELWGRVVARSWVAAVQSSLDLIRAESERRAVASQTVRSTTRSG